MTELCKKFIKIRKESKSFAEAMKREGELKLFDKMTVDEIKYLHQKGYISAMVCSCAINALEIQKQEKTIMDECKFELSTIINSYHGDCYIDYSNNTYNEIKLKTAG